MSIDWGKEELEQVELPAVEILESLEYKYVDWEILRGRPFWKKSSKVKNEQNMGLF